jgi:RNA polymerase sigma-70 factor (ECF subfamily)
MAEFPPTRASLLLRLRDPRDGEAWTEFVDLYAPLVYGYLRRQGLQDADAADLTQEVLTAVAGAIGRLEYDPARGAYRNWLFTLVRRQLSNWRAAQVHRARGSSDATTYERLRSLAGPAARNVMSRKTVMAARSSATLGSRASTGHSYDGVLQ